MKQFRIKFYVIFIALLATSVALTSCDDDDDDDNNDSSSGSVTVDGNDIDFNQGVLFYYGEWSEGAYNFDITLFTSGINYNNQSGTGSILYFETFTSSDSFNGGTFNYTETQEAGTFDIGYLQLNYDTSSDELESYFYVTDGSITVSVDGDNYDIAFNLKVREADWETEDFTGEEQDLTGNYSGTLQYQDVSNFKGTKTYQFDKN